ncbi:histone-lysine N-methyltransferase 2C-like [Saccostrea echinata]|uniref:histone-lysine N-methyltransferase 2C-like n=1 Tax=Saccostrea echinata TaxID=191078 RepID=UPI002A83E499|nr:histone-lysine N-methyltransferase 2C-like [Saccostrea echinata]
MEAVEKVTESQPVQEPTSKNGSTEKSEKEPNLEIKTLQESKSQENGAHLINAKSPRCDIINEVKMEVTGSSADSSAVETVDKPRAHQNGPTEKAKHRDLTPHTENPPKTEIQVTQSEKCVSKTKSEVQPVKSESSNLVSSNNGNVATCGPFMSSIDAVINSVAHNIPPDEPSELDTNESAKTTVSDSHTVQNYDHQTHYMHQTNPKQTHVPQTNYGARTVNQPYNPQMFPHLKGQTIPTSANYGVSNNPLLASASEQLSSLVKSHVMDSGEHAPNDQQLSGHHPGIRPEIHPNAPPPTSMYNHQPMYRPMYDPNSGMPMHPPGPGSMHQQGAPAAHVRPHNEIPSSQDTKQPRIPQKGGARRQQRPSQAQQELPQVMRPRMPDQFNRGMRPMQMFDPRLMSTYFSPENIRMLQMRYPDPRMMPPQLLQQMQVFARMHQAQQAQQQQQQQAVRGAHPPSQPTSVSVTPGLPQHPQGIPPQSQASTIPSQQMSVEGSQPANSNAVKNPHHSVPPHPGQPYPHGPLSQHPLDSGKQGLNSQAQEAPVSRSHLVDINSTVTNGTEIQNQSGVQTALASTSAPHLPSDALNRPSSAGRPPSGGRPPSAGRPPSVGRPSSANRPPSVGRPTSTEPPLNQPPSVGRPSSSNSRPPSADLSSRPPSVGQSPSTPQSEASLGTTVSSASFVQEPAFSTSDKISLPSTSTTQPFQSESSVSMQSLTTSSSQPSLAGSSAVTQTPYTEETSREGASEGEQQKTTQKRLAAPPHSSTTSSAAPSMPPPFGPPTSMATLPQGYVQTPFGMLPHHSPGMTQGGVPFSGMGGHRMMPPHMRMPGFPGQGFPMPPHMQRLPPPHGGPLSPNSMQAMASLAQRMQGPPVSGQNVRPGMPPGQPGMGPRGINPAVPPASMDGAQAYEFYRMPFAMGPQQRPPSGPTAEHPPRGPRPKGPRPPRPPPHQMHLNMPHNSEHSMVSPGQGMMPGQHSSLPPDPSMPSVHSQVRPPSIGIGPQPSHHDSSTPSPKVSATPPANVDPALLDEMIQNTQVKQEPTDSCMKTEMTQEEKNALLKQLLGKKGQGGLPEESEDGVALTPEQRKQLELIENMPLVMEQEAKTPEEKERLLELKKQAYEQRRKEYELLRKQKRKQQNAENKKRKRKEKEAEEAAMRMDPNQPVPPAKKRPRKKKGESLEEDLDAKANHFLQMLGTLPPVALQEPKVGNFFSVLQVPGSPNVLTGDNCLKGNFGNSYLEGVADFYGNTLLHGLPPLGSFVRMPKPRDIESRRQFIRAGQDESGQGSNADQQRYQLTPDRFPVSGPPLGLPGLPPFFGRGEKPPVPSLPSSPRIEPRLEYLKGGDSPCTVISSSSPEHEFGELDEEFPMLKPIEPPSAADDRSSPLVPILQPVAIKSVPSKPKEEPSTEPKSEPIDKPKAVTDSDIAERKLTLTEKHENGKLPPNLSALTRPFQNANLNQDISVTLTLSANAADDIGGVLSQIAELLKIAVPPSYEVGSRSPSPEQGKINSKHLEDKVNVQHLIKTKAKFCRLCDSYVYDSGFRKRKCDIPFLAKEDYFSIKDFDDEEVTFCTEKCYTKFATVYQEINKPPPEDPLRSFTLSKHHSSDFSPRSMGSHTPTTPTKSDSTLTLTPTTPNSAGALTPVQPSPPIRSRLEDKFGKKHRRTASMDAQPPKPLVKKHKNVRYRRWDPSFTDSLPHEPGVPDKEIQNLWKALGTIIVPKSLPEDTRKCVFCQQQGDGETDGPGRLLNMDIDNYAHLNCALWSSEVYETLNGALMNVDMAYKRGLKIECTACGIKGATVGCFNNRCPKYYHLGCAKKVGCMFFQDKTILCPSHAAKQGAENVLESLSVFRRVYINRSEDKQVANMVHGQEEGQYILRIGSLTLHSVGQLLPHQLQTGKFHTRDCIYPVGFKSSRYYWSMKRLYKRCRYVCSIVESDGHPGFVIRIVEPGQEDVILQDVSPKAVWNKILEPLDKLRRNADLVKIFPSFTSGEELFGLTEQAIVRVVESLPGTDLLTNYNFKFPRSLRIEMPLTINPTGCARTEPKLRTHFRKPHTLQSANTSRSLPQTVTGVSGDINSPYMKQFVHSKSAQYRKLKTEWRTNVYLGRSRIQGLGLFAAHDLEKHTMVIEYIGYLIRNEVANRKEISYEEQNRGVYMFRIDNDTVVDATMAGGPARYINHSCNPNCVAEVVPFDKESKIIIITNRRIPTGEELTYDYKFDFEDEQHKIPCCCGAPNCRKWMN